MVVSKGKDGEKIIGKHNNNNNNNNNELNIFPLNMECFDKLKFRCLIKVVLNGPLTLY